MCGVIIVQYHIVATRLPHTSCALYYNLDKICLGADIRYGVVTLDYVAHICQVSHVGNKQQHTIILANHNEI